MNKYKRGSGLIHPADKFAGKQLKKARVEARPPISQVSLADNLGLTFQQIQKYETGVNRMSISRVCEISEIMKVPVTHFFESSNS